ncbi:hypothetical protein [Falsiroseomonas oryzae]|uniref:hypothetical protein n=1 Tax=Falsiroseomonas oryzae TaxID=2766473 RepID=UPI0022EB3244|nr:hypothetical protein [Roseomonas sp. MO-31]
MNKRSRRQFEALEKQNSRLAKERGRKVFTAFLTKQVALAARAADVRAWRTWMALGLSEREAAAAVHRGIEAEDAAAARQELRRLGVQTSLDEGEDEAFRVRLRRAAKAAGG